MTDRFAGRPRRDRPGRPRHPAPAGAGRAALWFSVPDPAVWSRTNPSTTALVEQRRAEARAAGRRYQPTLVWVPLERISAAARRRGGGRRGRQVLRARRLRLGGAPRGLPPQPLQPPLRPRRLHHHAAGGEEPRARHREEPAPEGARGLPHREAGAPARQAAHPGPLPQRGRVGRRRLRRRGGRAAPLRDQRRVAHHGPGGAAGLDAPRTAPGLALPGAEVAGRPLARAAGPAPRRRA